MLLTNYGSCRCFKLSQILSWKLDSHTNLSNARIKNFFYILATKSYECMTCWMYQCENTNMFSIDHLQGCSYKRKKVLKITLKTWINLFRERLSRSYFLQNIFKFTKNLNFESKLEIWAIRVSTRKFELRMKWQDGSNKLFPRHMIDVSSWSLLGWWTTCVIYAKINQKSE